MRVHSLCWLRLLLPCSTIIAPTSHATTNGAANHPTPVTKCSSCCAFSCCAAMRELVRCKHPNRCHQMRVYGLWWLWLLLPQSALAATACDAASQPSPGTP